MNNIFKHTSRTFFDVYNAYIQAYPTMPPWLFKEISGLFDFQGELMNRIASDILYPQTREGAYSFAARCDYTPTEASGATGDVDVTLTAAMAKTIPVGYQFGGISAQSGELVIFEVTAATASGGGSTVDDIPVEQKTSFTNINIGTVDNQADYMDYPIDGYLNIIQSSVSLTINSLTWTKVDNFDNSISTDRHFILIYQSSGKTRVQFGDGTTGLKPTLNDVIYADFATTKGLAGVMALGEIDINVGADPDILSLTNDSATSGGANSESISAIIRNARGNARLRGMVWSKEDLETAARAASSSVTKALGIPGTGTASIQIIPTGGGNPSAGLKTTVDTYVTALTQFGALPITVLDPSYVTQNITATATVRAGYTAATVRNLVEFALTIASSAYDNQVLEYYDDFGIDACRINVINVLWGWAFTSAENDALDLIMVTWKGRLGVSPYRQWGDDLEVGDLWIMGDSLSDYGVDTFNLTLPTTNVVTTATQIITTGTMAVT
jgi:hypothetical protein